MLMVAIVLSSIIYLSLKFKSQTTNKNVTSLSLPVFLGRPCVDCHAFEFMQRALQDLKKTAFNLDARVGKVL